MVLYFCLIAHREDLTGLLRERCKRSLSTRWHKSPENLNGPLENSATWNTSLSKILFKDVYLDILLRRIYYYRVVILDGLNKLIMQICTTTVTQNFDATLLCKCKFVTLVSVFILKKIEYIFHYYKSTVSF